MKIDRVEVTYGELRSTGYPQFSNTKHEIKLGANLDPGESARDAQNKLHELAKEEVRALFGGNEENELDIPF